jgi:hypothetical protein
MQQQDLPLLHPSADALSTAEVRKLLQQWQVKHVPLASARKGWQNSVKYTLTWITNFKRMADRLALCEMALTGELPGIGPSDTGSVVMFAVPAEFGERAFDECFLQVCCWRLLCPFHTQLLVCPFGAGCTAIEGKHKQEASSIAHGCRWLS